MTRVLVAMSGGVDSSVAAARMVDAGHDVVGVHLALSAAPGTLRTGSISGIGSSPDTPAPSANPRMDCSSSRVSNTRAELVRLSSPRVTP